MSRTYKAVLRGDRIEWIDAAPPTAEATPVHITLLEETSPAPQGERGRAMAEALEALAQAGAFAEIADPATWQRDRTLPGRES